MQENIPQDNN